MIAHKTVAILFLALVLTSLVFLSFHHVYFTHLRVDIYGQYLGHAKSFLENHNFAHIGYNEYQPVAVMFFGALSPALKLPGDQVINYVEALYIANIIFAIIGAFLIYAYTRNYTNIFIYALVLLFTGPIILHRFELLVFDLIALGLLFFVGGRVFLAGTMMGIATLTKIYPILFVPYLLYVSLKGSHPLKKSLSFMGGCIIGVAIVLFLFLVVFQANPTKIRSDLKLHELKPVHAESVWASAITLHNRWVNGIETKGAGDIGIFGIRREDTILPKWVFNYSWMVLIAILYIFLFVKTRKQQPFRMSPNFIYLIMLLFLMSSKIVAAQYLMWFSLIFCLQIIPTQENHLKHWIVDLFLILLAAFLSQFIYPLNYDAFLGYYTQGTHPEMFWILALRNLILAVLFISAFISFWKEHKKQATVS